MSAERLACTLPKVPGGHSPTQDALPPPLPTAEAVPGRRCCMSSRATSVGSMKVPRGQSVRLWARGVFECRRGRLRRAVLGAVGARVAALHVQASEALLRTGDCWSRAGVQGMLCAVALKKSAGHGRRRAPARVVPSFDYHLLIKEELIVKPRQTSFHVVHRALP